MSGIQPYLGEGFEPTEFGGDLDFFETPREAADAVRPLLERALRRRRERAWKRAFLLEDSMLAAANTNWNILEPSAGRGALVEFALTLNPEFVTAVEMDVGRATECAERFHSNQLVQIIRADALALDWTQQLDFDPKVFKGPRLALGNPPYSLATDFVERSIEWAQPSGVVAMLLQADFVTGVDRCERIHEKHKSGFHPLKRRPGFSGSGSKSGKRPFAWFIWDLMFPESDWSPLG